MEKLSVQNINKPVIAVSKKQRNTVILLGLLLAVLILGRALSNAFLYIFMMVSGLVFLFCDVAICFPLLMFVLPSATILKFSPDSMSFFTLLFFLVVAKMVLKVQKIKASLFVTLIFFVMFCLLFSGLGTLTTIVTIAAGFIMIYCLRFIETDAETSVLAFASGIIFTSLLSLFKAYFPIIDQFISVISMKTGETTVADRFAGLQYNPNFFTVDIILIIAGIVVLTYHKTARKSYTLYLTLLSVFGLMSVSKSFLVSFIVLIILWFVLSMKQGVQKLFKFLMIVLIAALVVYLFAYESINLYIFRLTEDQGGSMGEFTTGRSDIWMDYLTGFVGDIKIFFLGNGINNFVKSGASPHNTYLDLFYFMGIVGTVLFIMCLKMSLGRIVVKPIMWVPVIILLVRMMAIDLLTHDNLWFYFGLFVILAKELEAQTDDTPKLKTENYMVKNL